MRPLLPREQVLLWALGIVALAVAFVVFVYAPMVRAAHAVAAQLEAQRADAARLRQDAQRSAELESAVGDLRKSVSAVEARLSSARGIPPLLLQIDELAGRSGVTVTSIKPGVLQPVGTSAAARGGKGLPRTPQGSAPQAPQYQQLTIDLETKGTFASTLDFVRGLESFPRALAITNMQLTQAPSGPGMAVGGDPEDPVLTLGVTATVYVRPESGDTP